MQASDVAFGQVELKYVVQEGGRLGGAEPKCVGPDLAEVAARAKASERQRRVGPARDHEPQRGRQTLHEVGRLLVELAVRDRVVVVEHQGDRIRQTGEVVDQQRQDHLGQPDSGAA